MFGVDEMPDFRERVTAFCDSTGVPGYLVGVYQAGEPAIVAHGVANVVTGAPMRADTGFLFGSVTKIMTTMLVLQQVERGVLDLDEPVVTYLPEFMLTIPGAAGKIRVRHLLTHTSGIDADLFFPVAEGSGARSEVHERPRLMGGSCSPSASSRRTPAGRSRPSATTTSAAC